MHLAFPPHLEAHRRPAPLDLAAGGLLVATVVLHVVAMFPGYFLGSSAGSSLVSAPDQAALYSVLAASWALALVIGLTGPDRTPVAAALAVGVAAAELGFRVADLGDAFRYGTQLVGAGLWLMEAAWVVGAAAAVVAVLAARRRHHQPATTSAPAAATEWDWSNIDWSAPAVPAAPGGPLPNPYAPDSSGGPEATAGQEAAAVDAEPAGAAGDAEPAGAVAASASDPTSTIPVPPGASDSTTTMPTPDPTGVWAPTGPDPDGSGTPPPPPPAASPAGPATDTDDAHERAAWTMLVVVLALLVAGAFLPAWDHAVAFSTVTGRGFTRSLGNAFSGPWQQVTGTVLAAVALAAVPIVAIRLRNRMVGAAAVCGALLVLASQLVAAVVQVDQPVSPSQFGISSGQAGQLGLQLALKLTGWFTVDALAAYALFATVMVWATLRLHHENSPGTPPSAPEARRDAIPWAS